MKRKRQGFLNIKIWNRLPDGSLELQEEIKFKNLITIEGVAHSHQVTLLNVAQVGAWYILLLGSLPNIDELDTMASHAGWTEVVAYGEATRQVWAGVATGDGTTSDNTGAPATFTINANGTVIGGIAMCSSNVKGGAVGVLYSGGFFSDNDRVLNNTQVLTIEYGLSDTDDHIT